MQKKDKPFSAILIIGCGDIGRRVAKNWLEQGYDVHGLVRSADSAAQLEMSGIQPHLVDLDTIEQDKPPLPLENVLLYYFAPPPASGQLDTRMQHFLAYLARQPVPSRIIAISTSGVYGDQQGQRVTEQTPPNPQVDRARRRYDAEQQLQRYSQQYQVSLTLLRVGGIYGPGRLPLKRLRDQVPMLYEHLAPQTNRIHADDLTRVCVAAARPEAAGEIYNVSDGCDSNMTEYFNTIADYFDLPRPPLVDWEEAEQRISKGMLSYLKESRRMDNSKMINQLGVRLQYPDLKTGLASLRRQTEV